MGFLPAPCPPTWSGSCSNCRAGYTVIIAHLNGIATYKTISMWCGVSPKSGCKIQVSADFWNEGLSVPLRRRRSFLMKGWFITSPSDAHGPHGYRTARMFARPISPLVRMRVPNQALLSSGIALLGEETAEEALAASSADRLPSSRFNNGFNFLQISIKGNHRHARVVPRRRVRA